VTALVARECGVVLHAVQMMSTHIHEVLTDTRGELPRFLQERNRIFANALKVHRGWSEEVFSRGGASCVALYGASAIEKEIAYTISNCVESGLVSNPAEWPGVTVGAQCIGKRRVTASRPQMYFAPNNERWPDTAEIFLEMPRAVAERYGGLDNARTALVAIVDRCVQRAANALGRVRRTAKELRELCLVPIDRRSTEKEQSKTKKLTFAAGGDRMERCRAQLEHLQFYEAYRSALHLLRQLIPTLARRNGPAHVAKTPHTAAIWEPPTLPSFPVGAWRWRRELCNENANQRALSLDQAA
jgi:putative transposase